MKHSKKHSTSERSIEKKFRNVQNTQEGIQSLTVWAIHHQDQAEKIVKIWSKVFLESAAPHTLTLMYSCNDIVQNCRRKNAVVYKDLFKQHLPEVLSHISKDESVIPPVQRIFKIWVERLVFEEDTISEFQECLISDEVREKIQQEEIDKKLLSEFKPNKVVESLRGFRRLELDADLKYRQISNLRLDLTNSEAIKQLKDRAHGNEYTRQFEDHSKHLEEFEVDLVKVMQERTALIELLELTEHFYELQYGEALVVANAYKNFGLRVQKQESQLDGLMKSFPGSPIRGSFTPPRAANLTGVIDMEMSEDERGEDDEPPVEPYSPSMMDSPERPVGSPISPNTSLTDLDIVKGVAQPYDPLGTHSRQQHHTANVYNPKAALDTRSNDINRLSHNLMQAQQNSSFSGDGDGTPTQDEFMDSSAKKDSNEDDWDLAYEFLEENMDTSINSGAVSISNLTTIQPTTDFSGLTNNTAPTPKGVEMPGLNARVMSLPPGLFNDAQKQNGSHSSSSSPSVAKSPSAGGVPSLMSATLIRSNSEPVAGQDEDPNARAQREFLERLTKRGPFKPSRFLQNLTEKKAKPASAETPQTTAEATPQFAQYQDVQAVRPPNVEYRIGSSKVENAASIVPPAPAPTVIEARIHPPHVPQPVQAPVPHGAPPVPSPVQAPVQHTSPPIPTTIPPAFVAPSTVKLNDRGLPSFPPDFPSEFPPRDQDMRQFNRPPPPPPPPPPRPFINNAHQGGKPFPGPLMRAGAPPPPPPDFATFRRLVPNSRMDSPPPWQGVPPPGPPPFFRPRFS